VPVPGEEITVAVLGNTGGELQARPPVGIYPRFCDHFDERAKYTKDACDEVAPPRGWDAACCAPVMDLAVRCHRALGCDGMSRTDMIVGPDGPVVLELVRTPDILQSLGAQKGKRLLVGFAAETEKVEEYAAGKLRSKSLDLIVANDVSRSDAGFGGDRNAATLIDAAGEVVEVPLVSKRELAERILDRVVELRRARSPKPVATRA